MLQFVVITNNLVIDPATDPDDKARNADKDKVRVDLVNQSTFYGKLMNTTDPTKSICLNFNNYDT